MPRPPPRATPEVAGKEGSPEMTPNKPTCVRDALTMGRSPGPTWPGRVGSLWLFPEADGTATGASRSV